MKIRTRSLAGRPLRRSPVLIVAVTVAALPVLFGTVRAAIPDGATGKISGCYAISGGSLRVIDTDAVPGCRADENRLDWSQTGPPGPTGPTGATGPTGPQGPPGTSGYHLESTAVAVSGGGDITVNVLCAGGAKPFGGGFNLSANVLSVLASYPDAGGWVLRVHNGGVAGATVIGWVVCAAVS